MKLNCPSHDDFIASRVMRFKVIQSIELEIVSKLPEFRFNGALSLNILDSQFVSKFLGIQLMTSIKIKVDCFDVEYLCEVAAVLASRLEVINKRIKQHCRTLRLKASALSTLVYFGCQSETSFGIEGNQNIFII